MFCPHCCLENICSICGKEMFTPGCKSYQSNIIWCEDCQVKIRQEKKIMDEQEKKNDKITIGACINRDYTEKLYRQNFKLQPSKLKSLIENHRRNVYKNTRNAVKMTKQQQDYTTKSTEHL